MSPPSCPIAITGTGVVSPFGVGLDLFREGILEARSCLRTVDDFAEMSASHGLAGNVPDFQSTQYSASPRFGRLPKAYQYAMVAADEALRDARLDPAAAGDQCGVFFATDHGAIEQTRRFVHDLLSKSPRLVSPLLFQNTTFAAGAGEISLRYGIKGPSYTMTSGYISLVVALYAAVVAIMNHRVTYGLVVGCDELSAIQYLALSRLGCLAGTPARSCPFDVRRNGFIPAEGAVAFVLESSQAAAARGQAVQGHLLGLGLAHDTGTGHQPSRDGCGFEQAMRQALTAGRTLPAGVDFVSAAANSSPRLDRAEAAAIRRVSAERDTPLQVTALKSLVGEAHAAAAGMQVASCLISFAEGIIVSTRNYALPDPECPVTVVAEQALRQEVNTALVNSFSPGGACGSILLAKPE
jgi:3-oxoacyl-[acyl-carrier-protein] synthase II